VSGSPHTHNYVCGSPINARACPTCGSRVKRSRRSVPIRHHRMRNTKPFQPLGVSTLVFALPIGARTGPSPVFGWSGLGAGCVVVDLPMVLSMGGRRRSRRRRCRPGARSFRSRPTRVRVAEAPCAGPSDRPSCAPPRSGRPQQPIRLRPPCARWGPGAELVLVDGAGHRADAALTRAVVASPDRFREGQPRVRRSQGFGVAIAQDAAETRGSLVLAHLEYQSAGDLRV
jgi:hypothetical protein